MLFVISSHPSLVSVFVFFVRSFSFFLFTVKFFLFLPPSSRPVDFGLLSFFRSRRGVDPDIVPLCTPARRLISLGRAVRTESSLTTRPQHTDERRRDARYGASFARQGYTLSARSVTGVLSISATADATNSDGGTSRDGAMSSDGATSIGPTSVGELTGAMTDAARGSNTL